MRFNREPQIPDIANSWIFHPIPVFMMIGIVVVNHVVAHQPPGEAY
jgi:hypothetical protein